MKALTYIAVMIMLVTGCVGVSANDTIWNTNEPAPTMDPAVEVVLLRIQIEQLEAQVTELKWMNDACYSDMDVIITELWATKASLEMCKQAFTKTL